MSVEGKVAVVTGNTPVAYGVARVLAAGGAKVALAGWSQGGGEAVAREAASGGKHLVFIGADVTRPVDVRRLSGRVKDEMGTAVILVNAAETYGLRSPLLELYEDEFDDLLALHLRAPHMLARTFVPGMIDAGGGNVVMLCSPTASGAGSGGFEASRAGLAAMTAAMGAELRSWNVRVNAVDVGDPSAYMEHTGSRGAALEIPAPAPKRHRVEEIVDAVARLCDCPPELTGKVVRPGER